MPRRTIVIGNQPSQFQFQDDFGPLNNGLAYFAGQWLASGRDRAQIEAGREASQADAEQKRLEREQDVDFRERDFGLRELALGNQDADRKEQRRIQDEQLRATKVRDAADAAAKWRDDMGAMGKYALDGIREAFTPNSGRSLGSASDLAREKFNREKAVQEIGDIDYRMGTDELGQPVKIPLTPQERQSQIDRINSRELELNGVPFTSLPNFDPNQTAPVSENGGRPPRPPVTVVAQPAQEGADLTNAALGNEAPVGTPVDLRTLFIQNTGINPDPKTGITVDDFIGEDNDRRAAAIRALPPLERKKAIAVLRQMGF